MSIVALTGSFVWVIHLLLLFNLCLLNLLIYFVSGYHVRWRNKAVYIIHRSIFFSVLRTDN